MLKVLSLAYWTGKNALFNCALIAISTLGYGSLVIFAIFILYSDKSILPIDLRGSWGILGSSFVIGITFGQFFLQMAAWAFDNAETSTPYYEMFARLIAAILISVAVPFALCALLAWFEVNIWIQVAAGLFAHYISGSVGGATIFELVPYQSRGPERLGAEVKDDNDMPKDTGLPPHPEDIQQNDSVERSVVSETHQKPSKQKVESLELLLKNLDSMIGLEGVKAEIRKLINFVQHQKEREREGLPTEPLSQHLVFHGNPGTGKTEIARLVAKIYKELGLIKKGHLVEAHRSDLIGEYIGQAESLTRKKIEEAIGGVLFIDEAHTLFIGGGHNSGMDFGRRVTETLLKQMEDRRADFIVIVAGYTDKMKTFVTSDQGLKDRFRRFIKFDDYRPDQLVQILVFMAKKRGYELSPEAEDRAFHIINELWERRDEGFSNARMARKMCEAAIEKLATRIESLSKRTKVDLQTIQAADIPEQSELSTGLTE